jgi:hypothetical protein
LAQKSGRSDETTRLICTVRDALALMPSASVAVTWMTRLTYWLLWRMLFQVSVVVGPLPLATAFCEVHW